MWDFYETPNFSAVLVVVFVRCFLHQPTHRSRFNNCDLDVTPNFLGVIVVFVLCLFVAISFFLHQSTFCFFPKIVVILFLFIGQLLSVSQSLENVAIAVRQSLEREWP